MPLKGKFVIVLMIAIALTLSAYAWWHQYQRNPRTRSFWGTGAILAIQHATDVEFLEFSKSPPVPGSLDLIMIEGKAYTLRKSTIRDAPGLIHVRHALINDATFDWRDVPACDRVPEFALAFRKGGEQVTIAFDLNCELLLWVEGQKQMRLSAQSTAAFRKKQHDWQRSTVTSAQPDVETK